VSRRSLRPSSKRLLGGTNREVDRVLAHIAHAETFPTVPIATVEGGVVRREFVDRFPYVVVFVETNEMRR
jgi:hypothetical protein